MVVLAAAEVAVFLYVLLQDNFILVTCDHRLYLRGWDKSGGGGVAKSGMGIGTGSLL